MVAAAAKLLIAIGARSPSWVYFIIRCVGPGLTAERDGLSSLISISAINVCTARTMGTNVSWARHYAPTGITAPPAGIAFATAAA